MYSCNSCMENSPCANIIYFLDKEMYPFLYLFHFFEFFIFLNFSFF